MSQAGVTNVKDGGLAVLTLTGNTGGAVPATANNINVIGDGTTVTVAGNPGTSTLTISVLGGHAIDTIDGDVGSVTGSTVTFTGGTSGAVFTGVGTIMTESFNYLSLPTTTSTNGQILINSVPILHTFHNSGKPDGNTFVGQNAGNFTNNNAGNNVGFGSDALHAVSTGNSNTALGAGALSSLTVGFGCIAIGSNAADSYTGAGVNDAIICVGPSLASLITGNFDIALGFNVAENLTTGSENIMIGAHTGSAYTSSESSNILINNAGVISENNVIRIGTQGGSSRQQNACYIAGITGVTAASSEAVFINSSTGQLGVIPQSSDGQVIIGSSAGVPLAATLSAGAGISISNGHNSITISASGAGFTWNDESTSFNAVAENGYFITGTTTATLPASPSQGNTIEFIVATGGSLTIQANTGQTISIGAATSASAGTAANNAVGDSVILVYRSASTKWHACSVIGTWTVT